MHAFDEVASILVQAGARVIAPYTRGFGLTRFVSDDVMRSGQQAARGCDIVQLADALGLERPILGGFDWGGNASCVAATLWLERIGGLVSYAGPLVAADASSPMSGLVRYFYRPPVVRISNPGPL